MAAHMKIKSMPLSLYLLTRRALRRIPVSHISELRFWIYRRWLDGPPTGCGGFVGKPEMRAEQRVVQEG